MSERKFDFEVIYFTNEAVSALEDEGILMKNLILPDMLRYILLQLVQNNYDVNGVAAITEIQVTKALEQAYKLSLDSVTEDMVKEGYIEYNGMTEDGRYIPELTDAGKELNQQESEMGKIMGMIEELKRNRKSTPKPTDTK